MSYSDTLSSHNSRLRDILNGIEAMPSTQEKIIEITSVGETEILPDKGYALSRVVANVNIEASGQETLTQEKSVDIDWNGTYEVTPDFGYKLSKVTANVSIPTQEKTVDATENGTVEVIADEGYLLSKATVNVEVASSGGGGGENKLLQVLNKTITELTANDMEGVTNIGPYAFSDCTSLASVTIPNSVTNIGEKAFNNCSNLTEVHIKDIDKWAGISFNSSYGNPLSLSSAAGKLYINGELVSGDITISGDVKTIGSYAFRQCPITSLTLLEGVTAIKTYAFYKCSDLAKVYIPQSLTSSGSYAFTQCGNIKEVHITDLAKWVSISFSSTTQSSSSPLASKSTLYLNGSQVTGDIVLPEGISAIGDGVFNYQGITSVYIPSSVTKIGLGSFRGCRSLNSVTFAENSTLQRVGVYAFSDAAVTDIVLPNSVTNIDSYAFRSCNLKNITIGTGITNIEAYGLASDKLVKIRILATTPPTVNSQFLGSDLPIIEVPAESVAAYKSKTNWSKYADQIVAITDEV